MSSVPLMALRNSERRSDEAHDSDQISDEEDEPLESVLANMKYRPQNYRPVDFWSSVIFLGATCFVIGFVVSYVLFLTIDQNTRDSQSIEYDADLRIASAFLHEISAASISKFVSTLITTRNELQHNWALKLQQHFSSLDFDSVSSVMPTVVTLSYYDIKKRNMVTVIDENGEDGRNFGGITGDMHSDVQGLSVSSVVNGTVVYINFGRESDFKYLETLHVGVENSIVLARLGKVPPVDLVHRCLEKRAIGVILFADPQQYPDSNKGSKPFLLPSHLGMLQKMHGNPATEGTNDTSCVPVQMISAKDAEYLFMDMSSNNPSPYSWKGSMNVSYQTGPGFSTSNWKLKMQTYMVNVKKTYYSVSGAIRGSREPDRYVLIGISHGSLSGNDNLGAVASMMELARVFRVLSRDRGWRPSRSVVFCSWGFSSVDGSVSPVPLVHDWGHLMQQRAVAYLDLDVAVTGDRALHIEATPLLFKTIYNASSLMLDLDLASAKPHIQTVFDSWLRSGDPKKPNFRVNIINSEGNAQHLLHDLGVPSLILHFMSTEGDSEGFRHHTAVAKLWALLTWLLADSLIVPFDTTQYAAFLHDSVNAVSTQYEKYVKAYAVQLGSAVRNFTIAAKAFQYKLLHVDKSKSLKMRIMNDQQLQLERAFLHHTNSPASSFARHAVFSSGTSVNVNRTAGFGVLQDYLDDLMSSPFPNFVQSKVEDYLQSVIHCITSASRSLDIPHHLPEL